MAFGDTVIGALSVYSATPYRYSNQDIAILSALANLAAISIENARLHNRVVTAEDQLRRNERLSTLGLLAAEVAHEIRNPLTVMKMLFHSLDLRFDSADPRSRDTEIVAEKMDHLNRIVDRLLGFASSAEPTLDLVRLTSILDDLILLTRHKLNTQKIQLQISLTPDLPSIRADRAQIEQACLNLILNAVEAMPDGGTLTIATAMEPTGIRLSFTDTGVGMTEEQKLRLFEPFLTTKTRGTGLGLAIVHRIVTEVHRGRIEVKTAPRRGTTFHLYLPL
jgi:signal transduction histidine kinase